MDILIYAIIPIVVGCIVPIATVKIIRNRSIRENTMNKTQFVMKASVWFSVMFLFFAVFIVITMVLFRIDGSSNLGMELIFIVITIFLLIASLQSLRQSLKYDNGRLEYTPIIGKTITLDISNVEKVTVKRVSGGNITYTVYSNVRKFSFSNIATGSGILIDIFRYRDIPFEEV